MPGCGLFTPFVPRRKRQIASLAIAAAALLDAVREHEPGLRHFQHIGLQSRIGKLLRHSQAVSSVLTILFVSVHGHTHATLSYCVMPHPTIGCSRSTSYIV